MPLGPGTQLGSMNSMHRSALGRIVALFLLFASAAPLLEAQTSTAVDIKLPGRGTVKSEVLTVYSEMSRSSGVVKSLKKGDALVVAFEIQAGADHWCKIREAGSSEWLGFAACQQIDRVKPPDFSDYSGPVLLLGEGRSSTSASNSANDQASSVSQTDATPAPDFTLEDLSGNTFSLSMMRGRAVLLDFWASWCGPCRAEMPVLERLHRQFAKRGLLVVGVNVDEPRETAARFIEQQGYTFTVLLDRRLEASMLYDARALPTLVLVDAEGNVTAYGHGTRTEAELRADLRRAGLR
jgi:thiol-disulfide isomerase/thioredoxin